MADLGVCYLCNGWGDGKLTSSGIFVCVSCMGVQDLIKEEGANEYPDVDVPVDPSFKHIPLSMEPDVEDDGLPKSDLLSDDDQLSFWPLV
jgi:hypothetical protein